MHRLLFLMVLIVTLLAAAIFIVSEVEKRNQEAVYEVVPDRPVRLAADRSQRSMQAALAPQAAFMPALDAAITQQAELAETWRSEAQLARDEAAIQAERSRTLEIATRERARIAAIAAERAAEAERQRAEQRKRDQIAYEAATPPSPPNHPSPGGNAAHTGTGDGVWDRLMQCEAGSSGGWAANTGNGYYGGLQFSLRSWQGVGGTGYPHEHSRETQIEMGKRLQAAIGWARGWPDCSRKLGLS